MVVAEGGEEGVVGRGWLVVGEVGVGEVGVGEVGVGEVGEEEVGVEEGMGGEGGGRCEKVGGIAAAVQGTAVSRYGIIGACKRYRLCP